MTLKLSAAQEAVRTSAPVHRAVVRAVAGAGKTRLLIERAQYLIGQGVPEAGIWFLVFTNAAQQELQNRLIKAKLGQCKVMTLHRFCINQLGGRQKIGILDDSDETWKKILDKLRLTHTRFRDVNRELEWTWQVPLTALNPQHRLLRDDAERRIRALEGEGKRYLRYTQVLSEVQEKWAADERALQAPQAQLNYLIVDEIQDISGQQLAILETLAGPRPMMAVGDPWQAIFSFQGAVPEVMQGLIKRAQVHALDITYRSPAQHTLTAEALTGQRLIPARGFAGSLAVYRPLARDAGDVLKAAVSDLLAQEDAGQVAVLVATNAEVAEVAAFLSELHLSVRTSTSTRYSGDPFCKGVLWPAVAYLTGRGQPQRRWRHPLVSLHGMNLPADDLALLHAAWRTTRPVEVVRELLPDPRLQTFFALWTALDAWTGPVEELHDFLTALVPHRHAVGEARQLCRRAQSLNDLALRLGAVVPEEAAQVVVSTIHGAKGREWPGVVLYDIGQQPSRRTSSEEMAEATRLRYVALTRSTRDLVAVLGPTCHPAYDAAFAPEVLARVRRLEAAFTDFNFGSELLAADLQAAPSVQTYLQDHAVGHMPDHHLAFLERLVGLERTGQTNPPWVQRVPLVGLPPEGRR